MKEVNFPTKTRSIRIAYNEDGLFFEQKYGNWNVITIGHKEEIEKFIKVLQEKLEEL